MEKYLEEICSVTTRGAELLDSVIAGNAEYRPSFLDGYGIGELQFNRRREEIFLREKLLSAPLPVLHSEAFPAGTREVSGLFRILDAAYALDPSAFTRGSCSADLTCLFIEILIHFRCHLASIYTMSGDECRIKVISINGMTIAGTTGREIFLKSRNACMVYGGKSGNCMFGARFAEAPSPGFGDELAVCIDDNIILLFDDLSLRERRFTQHELKGLMLTAGYIKARISERRDLRTGLLNMNAYYENRRKGFHGKGFFLIADADNFKTVNDLHGREFGDYVLSSIADIIKDSLGAGDRVYRMGGEEFLIWVDSSGGDGDERALALASAILKHVAGSVFARRYASCRVTISLGMAKLEHAQGSTPSDETWGAEEERAIELADRALYSAKNLGKNRVEFHA